MQSESLDDLAECVRQMSKVGVAAVLLDGSGPAGLTRGALMTLLGLGIGLVLGGVVTRIYDVRGFHRRSDAEPVSAAA